MLLSPKSDILQKHVGCYTTIVATTNVVIGDWFYNEAFHNKNERIYTNKGNELVLNLVQPKTNGSSKNNCSVYKHFSIFKPWLTISDKFEVFNDMHLFNVKNNLRKHWIKIIVDGKWQKNIKIIVQECGLFILNANEVIMINNQ